MDDEISEKSRYSQFVRTIFNKKKKYCIDHEVTKAKHVSDSKIKKVYTRSL